MWMFVKEKKNMNWTLKSENLTYFNSIDLNANKSQFTTADINLWVYPSYSNNGINLFFF